MSDIGKRRIVGVAIALAALLTAAGYGGWRAGRSDLARVAELERRIDAAAATAASLAAERDRLKADRDRLEAQLAAVDATPAACPQATLSTLNAGLSVRFIVEYPCGWSVLEQPMQEPSEGSPRFGLTVDHLFFSSFPISMRPGDRPPADITLDGWYDDPAVAGELPALDAWLAEARERFTTVEEERFETRSGIPCWKLAGMIDPFDAPRPAVLYVWEHTDADGVRRIYEAFSLEPGRTVRVTLDALVRSFRSPGG